MVGCDCVLESDAETGRAEAATKRLSTSNIVETKSLPLACWRLHPVHKSRGPAGSRLFVRSGRFEKPQAVCCGFLLVQVGASVRTYVEAAQGKAGNQEKLEGGGGGV